MTFAYNRVELIGRLGRDPEMQYTPNGQAVTRLSIATDRPKRTGAEPETDWHRVTCWGKLAEFAGQHLGKGRLVFVAGRLTYRTWEGKNGQSNHVTDIVARELTLLDRRLDAVPEEAKSEGDADDDDLPF